MQTLPLRFDLFGLIILLGVAQGLFLGLFFLTGTRRQTVANRCLGWLMLAFGAVLGEIWLSYTNYMFRTLALVDFAEPFNFVLGPLFFFFVHGRIHHQLPQRWHWHLIPFAAWLLNAITWLGQSTAFHYNSYLNAWHPELPFIPVTLTMPHDFTGLRPYINELSLLSCVVYSFLAVGIVHRAYRRHNLPWWAGTTNRVLSMLRSLCLLNALFPLLFVLVKPQFHEDLGDHLLASYITFIIYATSFLVMSGSDFFRDDPQPVVNNESPEPVTATRKKYEKSALSDEQEEAILAKLQHLVNDQKLYLDNELSLSKLAERLGTSSHYVSQILNNRLGQTFFDWLASHRIAEAQRLLNDPSTTHLKIDEIAEQVGYNAPSAFHTAFKRITGKTPASFRSARTSI